MRRKFFTQTLFCSLMAILFITDTLSAQRLLTESFNREVGNLNAGTNTDMGADQQNWWSFSGSSSYIQVVDTTLTYAGYQENQVGRAVKLPGNGADDFRQFDEVSSGKVYASAIVKINSAKSGDYFMTLGNATSNGMFAKLYVKKEGDSNIRFGIGKSTESSTFIRYTGNYPLGVYLIVLEYEFVAGETNDTVRLYINPTLSTSAATIECVQDTVNASGTAQGANSKADASSLKTINLRQGTNTPNVVVDEIRVATSWNDIFQSTNTNQPSIVIAPTSINFDTYTGEATTQTLNITATNLTEDITIAGLTSELTASVATINKDDAMATGGFNLTITLNTNTAGNGSANISLSSDGATTVTIPITWNAVQVTDVTDLADLRSRAATAATDTDLFRLSGEAVVSRVFNNYMYVQDSSGAMFITKDTETNYNVGQKVTRLLGVFTSPLYGLTNFKLMDKSNIVSENNTIQPVLATLAAMQAEPSKYEARLVRVEDITFNTTDNVFTAPSNINIEQNGTTAQLNVATGVDYVGNSIPTKANIVGFSTAADGKRIMPRAAADIEAINTTSTNTTMTDKKIVIYAENGMLCVEKAVTDVHIYDISGTLIASKKANDKVTFDLPEGVYIVTANGIAVKTVLK